MLRHGKSTFNQERRIQGRLDASTLTEAGRATARQVAVALRGITFDAISSSPLQRAQETAAVILSSWQADGHQPPLHTEKLLREIDLPLWEGMLRQDVKAKFPDDYQCWQERPHQLHMPVPTDAGVREHFPVLAIYKQAEQFWQEILPRHAGGTILVVAHNGINRALISTAVGIPPTHYHSIQQSNCGISVLNFPTTTTTQPELGAAVQLESMNLTSHVGEIFPLPRENHRGPRLLFVRHGETEWNRQSRFQGQIDVPLNDNGRAQSQKAAEFLKNVQIDFAVSSPMLRPKETAEIILQHHPSVELQFHDGLREISHGLWEGKYESEIEREFPGLLQQWKQSPETVQMPEGENLQQVWERAIAAWRAIVAAAAPNSTGLVIAHDAINKAILCHLFDLEPAHFWNFKQGNCAVTVIDYPKGADGPPVLQAINITTHIAGGVLDKTAAGAL